MKLLAAQNADPQRRIPQDRSYQQDPRSAMAPQGGPTDLVTVSCVRCRVFVQGGELSIFPEKNPGCAACSSRVIDACADPKPIDFEERREVPASKVAAARVHGLAVSAIRMR